MKELFDNKKIAILNDLTNNLRYSDITVIDDFNKYHFLEVKSGSQKFRQHKNQSEKLQWLEQYLDTDETKDLVQGQTMFRLSIHTPERHHRDMINLLIEQALQLGSSNFVEVEKGLAYYVDTPNSLKDADEIVLQEVNRLMVTPLPYILTPAMYNRPGYYPFNLLFKNPYASIAFYAGYIVILIFLDLKVLKERFASKGIDVEYFHGEDYCLHMNSRTGDNEKIDEMKISKYLLTRLFIEFISLDWFIEELANIMNKNNYEDKLPPEY